MAKQQFTPGTQFDVVTYQGKDYVSKVENPDAEKGTRFQINDEVLETASVNRLTIDGHFTIETDASQSITDENGNFYDLSVLVVAVTDGNFVTAK